MVTLLVVSARQFREQRDQPCGFTLVISPDRREIARAWWLVEQPHLLVDVTIGRGSSISRRQRSMFAKPLDGDRGTLRALPFDMHGTESIEAINGEQIATVTDLLLLRARNARRRLSTNKAAFANDPRQGRARARLARANARNATAPSGARTPRNTIAPSGARTPSTVEGARSTDKVRQIARGSSPRIAVPSLRDRSTHERTGNARDRREREERTLFVRVRHVGTSTASAAVVATCFAIAIVLTSLL